MIHIAMFSFRFPNYICMHLENLTSDNAKMTNWIRWCYIEKNCFSAFTGTAEGAGSISWVSSSKPKRMYKIYNLCLSQYLLFLIKLSFSLTKTISERTFPPYLNCSSKNYVFKYERSFYLWRQINNNWNFHFFYNEDIICIMYYVFTKRKKNNL